MLKDVQYIPQKLIVAVAMFPHVKSTGSLYSFNQLLC